MKRALSNPTKSIPQINRRRVFPRRCVVKKGRNWLKYLLLGIILLITFISALVVLISSKNLLPIGKVNCRMGGEVIEGPQSEWCSFLEEKITGKSLVFLEEEQLAQTAMTAFPAVAKISFEKHFPASVLVTLEKRLPVFSVFAEAEATTSAAASDFFWVDGTGEIFSEVEKVGLVPTLYYPEATGSSNFKVGGKLESGFLRFTAEVLLKLKTEGLEITLLRQGADKNLNLNLLGGLLVQFNSNKPVAEQVTILQLLIEKYRMEGRALKRVDLRFQDPVVEY